jgi:nucleoside-diphosphate-sugar epimerase
MKWNGKPVLVTGGASFIGSHLVDALVGKGAKVRIVDDLSSGRLDNIKQHLATRRIDFHQKDLRQTGVAMDMVKDMAIVFHLAAIHGGRGYIETQQAKCSENFIIDGQVIKAAHEARVEKIIFASSGCVYPLSLQKDVNKEVYLTEEMVGPPYEADGTYGWAKLMAELTLKAYYQNNGFKSVSCRFFTVYGERCLENQAIMAMIARAFIKQRPFEVWGDGTQVRNWTYISDIVNGIILAAEKIADASSINLGTEERIPILDAVKEVLRYTKHRAEIKLLPQLPTGPLNRVASNHLARKILGWEPKVRFVDGLHKTIDWYIATKDHKAIKRDINDLLFKR